MIVLWYYQFSVFPTSQVHSVSGTKWNNQSWHCYSTTSNILFRSAFFHDDKRWKETTALLSLRFETNHVSVWLHIVCLESAGCLKSEKTKKSTQFLCTIIYIWKFVVISLQVKINPTTAGKILFHQDDLLLKNTAHFFITTIKEGRKNLIHYFTYLSLFQILLFPWPNILPGNTLDNRSEKLCGWGVSLLAFAPLNFLITKFVWNFTLVLITKQK